MVKDAKLQALEIPEGWLIEYQQFYDIEPTKENVESIDACFNEDIFQFTHARTNRLIDLGWYPEHDWKNGSYALVVYEGDFTGKLLFELKSRDKALIVSETNRLLWEISLNQL